MSDSPVKHVQQVRPALFRRLADGSMSFWLADLDDGFQLGDLVVMREFNDEPITPTDGAPKGLTGEELDFRVGFVLFLKKADKVVLSLLPPPKKRT